MPTQNMIGGGLDMKNMVKLQTNNSIAYANTAKEVLWMGGGGGRQNPLDVYRILGGTGPADDRNYLVGSK